MSSVTETKTARRVRSTVSANCRAKEPRTCPYHGTILRMEAALEAKDLDGYFVEKDKLEKLKGTHYEDEVQFVPAPTPLNSAFNFDPNNVKDIKPPKWWKQYVQQSETEEGSVTFPTTPELLDVITSPVGDLAVVWEPTSQAHNDQSIQASGMEVAVVLFKSVKTGKNLGYLKTTWVSPESHARSFGTDEFDVYRFRNYVKGESYYVGLNFDGYVDTTWEEPDIRPEDTTELEKRIWLGTRKDLHDVRQYEDRTYIASYNLREADVPKDMEIIRKDNNRDKKLFIKDMNDRLSFYSSETPFVDFLRTEAPLKGKGYGSALYVYAAKQLSKQGAVLRASGVQSDDAEGLWARLKKTMPTHVSQRTMSYDGKEQTYDVLDFRS